jgi:glutathione synthase/RimK-type ligase-like ATP-grasp enzyme
VHDIGTPETVTRLRDARSVAAAYARLGPDVVIKASLGYRGAQVHGAHSLSEAIAIAAKTKQPIMQRMVDVGSSDVRLHFSRDWKTGLLHPVGAVERVSLGTDFRTNLSMGGAARPIYDFSGSDPALASDMVDEARRAGDAAGLDWFSADVARDQATGRPLLFEVDTKPTALEIHFPVPRAHQTYGHLADLLLHGDNATLSAARGSTLQPGQAR